MCGKAAIAFNKPLSDRCGKMTASTKKAEVQHSFGH
jgi:hypothetical protein